MKHYGLKACAYLLCLCSCNNMQEELSDLSSQEKLFPLQFSVDLQQEVLPFPSTKSMPSLDIPEPKVKGQESGNEPSLPPQETETLYKQIDYLVYVKGEPNILVKHKQFKLGDPDFSIIYDSLPRGDYHFCFLAHSDNQIAINGEIAEFQKVSDTFHLYHTQSITAGEKVVKDVTLKRIISKVEFVATDTVTTDLNTFSMNISGYQNKIDVVTGLGISENASYSNTYNFKEEDFGRINFKHSFFTFVPKNGSLLTADLTATNKQGENTRQRMIKDIQARQNFIIRYSGHLYIPPKSNDTFTIDILNGGIWDDTINNELKD